MSVYFNFFAKYIFLGCAQEIKTGQIAGRITAQSGEIIREASVAIASGTAPFPDIAALTNEQGYYKLSNIPAGTFEVAVYGEGYVSQKQTVTIKAGEVSTLNFTLVHEK